MIRVQFSRARARASARPRPREAPVMIAVRCDGTPVISYASWSCLNTMYRPLRRRETSGRPVFVLYQSTGQSDTVGLFVWHAEKGRNCIHQNSKIGSRTLVPGPKIGSRTHFEAPLLNKPTVSNRCR